MSGEIKAGRQTNHPDYDWEDVVHQCEQILDCPDAATSPSASNLPNLVRELVSDKNTGMRAGEGMKMSLKEIYSEFSEECSGLAKKAFGDMLAHYIPFAETDLDSNVYFRAEEMFKECMTGNTAPEQFQSYNFAEVRAAIWRDHKHEIIMSVIEDKDREIARMKRTIEILQDSRR